MWYVITIIVVLAITILAYWQWLGKLSPDMLKLLCEIADLMNDINYEKPKGEL